MRSVAGCLALIAMSLSAPAPSATSSFAGDTVFVRSSGPSVVHRLVEELRIAPGAEDTTLFTEVWDFKIDLAGRFWVFDPQARSLFLFDQRGKLLRRIGREGGGPGEFKYVSGMVTLGDTGLAVWDAQLWRISFFSAKGDFRTSWPTPSGFSMPEGLVTDRSGALYLKLRIAAPKNNDIIGRLGLVRVSAGGKLSDSLTPPELPVTQVTYVAKHKDANGTLRSSTAALLPDGARSLWAWHPAGYFVVAHGGNYEIVLARPGMPPLAIRREAPPVALSVAERTEQRDQILWTMRRTDPGWSWTGPGIPDTKAPLAGLRIGRDGRIWAAVAQPSERIPESELVTPRDKSQPVHHFRSPLAYEVFATDGRLLGRVNFPPRSRLLGEADGNTVWVLLRDADDLPAVVRFRIEPGLR